ncbi:MAG: 2-amino-4-hydroxy-6-hydroxymethyldihydropteridine diphosphokinase [Pirellulaceae bacterium]
MTTCLVALGANLGQRRAALSRAVDLLRQAPHIHDLRVSRWLETPPVATPDSQDPFLNGALRLETTRPPEDLLDLLLQIEDDLGRRRDVRWGARAIDLDLLLYGEQIVQSPRLQVPHPWMAVRRFVLAPAVEVAAEMIHPQIGWSVSRLLEHLNSAAEYVALTGVAAAVVERIAGAVAARCGWNLLRDPVGEATSASAPVYEQAPVYEREASLLSRRAGAIAEAGVSPSNRVLSAFWVEQSLACGLLTQSQREALSRQIQAARQTAASPKLVVLLKPREGAASSSAEAIELERLAARPGRGPFLVLDDEPEERAVTEVLAALEAMD